MFCQMHKYLLATLISKIIYLFEVWIINSINFLQFLNDLITDQLITQSNFFDVLRKVNRSSE